MSDPEWSRFESCPFCSNRMSEGQSFSAACCFSEGAACQWYVTALQLSSQGCTRSWRPLKLTVYVLITCHVSLYLTEVPRLFDALCFENVEVLNKRWKTDKAVFLGIPKNDAKVLWDLESGQHRRRKINSPALTWNQGSAYYRDLWTTLLGEAAHSECKLAYH